MSQITNLILETCLLIILIIAYIDGTLGSYGIITTFKNNLIGFSSGEVYPLSTFNHENGVYYVGDNLYQVRLINRTTNEDIAVAGTGDCCYGGDGGPALSATMQSSADVYVTSSGEIYFTEPYGYRIRYVDTAGIISTVAGRGIFGYSDTPTLAINANLYSPVGLVLDKSENIYFSDLGCIRKVTRSTGIMSTIAGVFMDYFYGRYYVYSSSGDGGFAVNATVSPHYIDLDSDENIIFTCRDGKSVRRISKQSGIISTIVSANYATSGISVDRSTNDVYFSEITIVGAYRSNRILRARKVYNSDSYSAFEQVVGGNGVGYSGDGGDASLAQINMGFNWANVEFVSSSPNGAFFIADRDNRVIRLVTNPCEVGSQLYGKDCWCSKGYYSDNGLAPCNQCDFGSYSDSLGGDISDCKCQPGFYSSTGYAPCDACPEGTESKIPIGASSCTCMVGYTGQGDEVPNNILVDTGLMKLDALMNLHDFYSPRLFAPPCEACPANSGTWDMYGSYPEDFRPGLQYMHYSVLQEKQGNKCLCDPDTKSSTGFGPCEPCAEGSGSITIKTNIDYYDIHCAPLQLFPSFQMTKCFCKGGFYSPDGTDSGGNCQKCPTGKTSVNVDLKYQALHYQCVWNYQGYSNIYELASPTLNKKCVCSRNYYKNYSAIIASSGHQESSNDCIQCPEGGATTDLDGTSCTICDIGYYSPTGSTPCTKCADGTTTDSYQRTSCDIVSSFAPTPIPTAYPTPSSSSITNPPIPMPTRPPAQTKRPTAYPTIRPTQASACPQGYFSSTGFTPGCEKCPAGMSTSESGMEVCDICSVGYFGRDGSPPCTACPPSYVSNEKRTGCYLCVGYEPGCSLSGPSVSVDIGNGYGDSSTNWITGSFSVLTEQIEHLDGKLRAQQSYIERYKRQRNLGSAPGMPSFSPSPNPSANPTLTSTN